MNYRIIAKTLGKYLSYFSLVLIIPLFVSLYYRFVIPSVQHPQRHSVVPFLITIFICLIVAFIFQLIGKNAKGSLLRCEGILLVCLIWIMTAFISATPFYLTKTLENPVDAYFESMSGLTTTGASVLYAKSYSSQGKEIPIKITNAHVQEKTYEFYGTITPVKTRDGRILKGFDAIGKGILFWRSFIQWLGGMGIVVLFLSVLPALAVGGKYLFQMEVPGPTKDTITPRIKDTASILWKLYFTFTIIQVLLLIWTNNKMPIFDAFCITFSTLSTGGFTLYSQSIGSYHNIHTEWVVIIFMLIGASNFTIYFHLIKRKLHKLYEPDFLFFIVLTFIGAMVVALGIIGQKQMLLDGTQSNAIYSFSDAIREGFFQSVSAQTSTGFSTANYDLWPFAPQLILLMLMFVGGMSGSTAGGIKTSRIYILIKIVIYKIKEIFHPEEIKKLKIGKQAIDTKTSNTVLVFFAIVIFFTVAGTIALTFNNIDPETSVSVVVCMLNNIGMSFRGAGPTATFAILSNFGKILSCFLMLLGRLEYFTLLLIFVPSFWKKY